jgi:hypothetical protein
VIPPNCPAPMRAPLTIRTLRSDSPPVGHGGARDDRRTAPTVPTTNSYTYCDTHADNTNITTHHHHTTTTDNITQPRD